MLLAVVDMQPMGTLVSSYYSSVIARRTSTYPQSRPQECSIPSKPGTRYCRLKTVSLASFSVQASPAFTGNLGSKPTVCNSTIGKGHTQQSRHPEPDKLVSFVPKQTRRAVVHWNVGRVLWVWQHVVQAGWLKRKDW
nr:hypothetical protein CFP56_09157 [Quercus suber]